MQSGGRGILGNAGVYAPQILQLGSVSISADHSFQSGSPVSWPLHNENKLVFVLFYIAL